MAEKFLGEAEWKAFAKNRKLKDDALVKALQACEKAEKGPAPGFAEALEKLRKEAQALRKASKGDGAVEKQLDKVLDAADRQYKEATQAAQAAADAEAAEEATPALLTTKMKPLLREVKRGEVTLYALVCTAGANTAVLIERRTIGTARRKLLSEAADAAGGAKFWPAQCTFEENALTFLFETAPAGMAKRIHAALLQQTELRIKVRIRGKDGSSEDHGETAAEPQEGAASAAAAAPAASAEAAPAPAAPSEAESAYRQKLEALQERLQQAASEAHPELQKIRALVGFASEKADGAGDFAAAGKALDMVSKLLAAAPAAAAAAPAAAAEDPARAFNSRLTALVPRIRADPKALADAGTPQAQPVAALAAEAGVLAKARRYDEAHAVLTRIEGALGAGAGGKLSLVKLGKARVEWIAARNHARSELARLRAILESEYRGQEKESAALKSAQERIAAMTATIDEQLELHLDRLLNAAPDARPPLMTEAREVLGRMEQLVLSDPMLALIDGNEYAPDMAVAAPLRARLQDISLAMA